MRQIGLIPRAFFIVLAIASINPNDQISTLVQTGSRPLRPTFEAGVLIGDYFAVIVICLILVFFGFGKILIVKANKQPRSNDH